VGALDAFIERWRDAGGSERANYQLFLTELCMVLDLPRPDPARRRDPGRPRPATLTEAR
jgi:hypothetical protein